MSRWQKLREVPPALADGVPNLEAIRETVLRSGPEAWDTVYALVDGVLPLSELKRPGAQAVVYLQADVQVVQSGPIEIDVPTKNATAFWVDDQAFEKRNRAVVTLTPGRHRITVRVLAGATGGLRVDLRKPAGSPAHFDLAMIE